MDGWVVDGRKISRRMKLPACSSMPAIFEPMGLYRRPSSSGYPPGVLCYQVFDLSQVCFSPPVLANGSSPATLFLFWRRYLANRAGVAADYSVFIPVRLAWGLIPGGSEAPKKKVLRRYRDMLWLYAKRCESYAEHEAGKWTASWRGHVC